METWDGTDVLWRVLGIWQQGHLLPLLWLMLQSTSCGKCLKCIFNIWFWVINLTCGLSFHDRCRSCWESQILHKIMRRAHTHAPSAHNKLSYLGWVAYSLALGCRGAVALLSKRKPLWGSLSSYFTQKPSYFMIKEMKRERKKGALVVSSSLSHSSSTFFAQWGQSLL